MRDVEIYALAVSPRGDRLAIGDAFGEVQLFEHADAAPDRRVPARRAGWCSGSRSRRTARTLAVTWLDTTAADTMLDLVDVPSLARRLRVELPGLPEPTDFVGASAAFTADGRDLVVLQEPFPNNQPTSCAGSTAAPGAVVGRPFRFRGDGARPGRRPATAGGCW